MVHLILNGFPNSFIVRSRSSFFSQRKLWLTEEYWRSPFLNDFYWSEFWSRKWITWKNFEWFCCWTKWRVERKESGFLILSLVYREREIEVWKNAVGEQFFLFTCGVLQQFFFQFFWLRGFVKTFLNFRLCFGSGLKVSGNSKEFYANSEVSKVFC